MYTYISVCICIHIYTHTVHIQVTKKKNKNFTSELEPSSQHYIQPLERMIQSIRNHFTRTIIEKADRQHTEQHLQCGVICACVQTQKVNTKIKACLRLLTNCTISKSRQFRRLTAAKHLCGPLVSFINPGLVGFSLRDSKKKKM